MKLLCILAALSAGLLAVTESSANGLAESYSMALKNNPRLKAAAYQLEATKNELDKAQAGYLPKIQLALNRGKGSTDAETGNPLSSGQRSYDTSNYSVTLKQPIINFGLNPDKQKALENISISELKVQTEAQMLFSQLSEKYFAVLYASDVLQTNQSKISSLEQQRIQAEKRFRAGVAIKNDISDLDAEIALLKAQTLEAQLQVLSAKKQFEVLVGVFPERLSGLNVQKFKASTLDSRSLEDWLLAVKEKNADLVQASKDVKLRMHQYDKDKSMHYPTLDFVISRSQTESDSNITIGSKFDTVSGMLQLNLPIYSGGFTSATVSQSASLIEVAKQNEDVKYLDVFEKVSIEYSNLQNARNLINAYDSAIKFYEISLAGANKAYLAGTRTLGDVLKMRDRLTEAHLNLSKTSYQYLTSYIRLKQLAGEIAYADFVAMDDLLLENSALP